jgi:hypothetical protein
MREFFSGGLPAVLPRNMKYFIFPLLICIPLVGCTTTSPTVSASAEYDRISQKTGRKDISILIVPPSAGMATNAITMGIQSVSGEASLPRSIRAGIRSAKEQGYRTYITGSSRDKTEWALTTALSNAHDGELYGAVIYLDPPVSSRIAESARKAGARVISP